MARVTQERLKIQAELENRNINAALLPDKENTIIYARVKSSPTVNTNPEPRSSTGYVQSKKTRYIISATKRGKTYSESVDVRSISLTQQEEYCRNEAINRASNTYQGFFKDAYIRIADDIEFDDGLLDLQESMAVEESEDDDDEDRLAKALREKAKEEMKDFVKQKRDGSNSSNRA